MKKDSFWFSHDSDAKDDPKCMKLIDQLGLEGYGIYWILIETLRNQPEYKYPLEMLSILGRRYNTSGEKMKVVVLSFGLFSIENDELFFSLSLMDRMLSLDMYRQKKSEAGKKSAMAKAQKALLQVNTVATDVQQRCNTSQLEEKRREEKSIVEKNREDKKINKTIPPSFEILSAYCSERKSHIDPAAFFAFYESKGWMIGKERMKDWQAAVRTWEQRTPRTAAPVPGEDPVQKMIREQREYFAKNPINTQTDAIVK